MASDAGLGGSSAHTTIEETVDQVNQAITATDEINYSEDSGTAHEHSPRYEYKNKGKEHALQNSDSEELE